MKKDAVEGCGILERYISNGSTTYKVNYLNKRGVIPEKW